MANPEHLAILKQGVERWNKWRAEHPELHPDLSGANLEEADLIRAKLNGVDFREANIGGANLPAVRTSENRTSAEPPSTRTSTEQT